MHAARLTLILSLRLGVALFAAPDGPPRGAPPRPLGGSGLDDAPAAATAAAQAPSALYGGADVWATEFENVHTRF